MQINELINKMNLKVLAGEKGLCKEITDVYIGDLLSWVMSHGKKGDAWITIQIHPNIIAVAVLLEFSCIIIPESIEVEEVTLQKADEENIPVLQSSDSTYSLCKKLSELGI